MEVLCSNYAIFKRASRTSPSFTRREFSCSLCEEKKLIIICYKDSRWSNCDVELFASSTNSLRRFSWYFERILQNEKLNGRSKKKKREGKEKIESHKISWWMARNERRIYRIKVEWKITKKKLLAFSFNFFYVRRFLTTLTKIACV